MNRLYSRWMLSTVLFCLVGGWWGCTDLGNEPSKTAGVATPVALPATGITATSFIANWEASANATGYRIDVSKDSLFRAYEPGLQDKSVGSVTNYSVGGLTAGTRYFYRVRAVGPGGTSTSSNTVGVTVAASSLISFQLRVLPILTNYGCTGCHGGSGGLFVGTVSEILSGGDHGPAVVPFSSGTSNLVKKLSSPPPFGSRMPLGGTALPADTIAVLKSWIDQGALNN